MINKYLVVLEGRNCLMRNIGNNATDKYGFFASRYVEAECVDAAQRIAVQEIKDELIGIVKNELSNPPLILIEETRSVTDFDPSVATKGFTFYVDEDTTQ